MKKQINKTVAVFIIIFLTAGQLFAGTSTPSDYDQYMLELINRARLDPAGEAARYGISLNEGLSSGTISFDPKQPLAFDGQIILAAQKHTQWMLNNDTFSHTGSGGSSPGQRITAEGYNWSTYGENIAAMTSGSLKNSDVSSMHQNLFVDSGISGRGHRKNIMEPNFESVGIGVLNALWGYNGWNQNSSVVTEDFGANSSGPFLTGALYQDGNGDSFYTPGEGLGSVTVTAVRESDAQTFTVQTWNSGGYTLEVNAGTYAVTFSGGSLSSSIVYSNIVVNSKNVKVDLNGLVSGGTYFGARKVINKKRKIFAKALVSRTAPLINQTVSFIIDGETNCQFSGTWIVKKKSSKLKAEDAIRNVKGKVKIFTAGKKAGTIILKGRRNDKSTYIETGEKTVVLLVGTETYEYTLTFVKGKAKP